MPHAAASRCCRRPYFQQEGDFNTLFTLCKALPGYKDSDAAARREASAKVLTSLVQRDAEARRLLITSGSLKAVLLPNLKVRRLLSIAARASCC